MYNNYTHDQLLCKIWMYTDVGSAPNKLNLCLGLEELVICPLMNLSPSW